MSGHHCDVCGINPSVGVVCSALGPVSWAYCRECLAQGAEPAVMFDATIDGCCGSANVADWVRLVKTFIDGRYISFDEYAQAMEAGTAKTEGLGPKDDSAVPQECAPASPDKPTNGGTSQ